MAVTCSPIAEGDQIVLALQTARFLVRSCQSASEGRKVPGQAEYLSSPWYVRDMQRRSPCTRDNTANACTVPVGSLG